MIDEVQTYPTAMNVNKVQDFLGLWGLWVTFITHLAQCLCPLYHLVKKGHMWDRGSEQ